MYGTNKRISRRSSSNLDFPVALKLTKFATYLNNGINIADLDKLLSTVRITDYPLMVFTLDPICYQKDLALFYPITEAMPRVNFLWIGDGEMRDELNALKIKITEWAERGEAPKLSMNVDVFLLTFLWEGMSVSLFEAMYLKKLCVVNNVIGNHDSIHKGIKDLICKSVEGFDKAIGMALTYQLITIVFIDIKNYYYTVVMAQKYADICRGGQHGIVLVVFLVLSIQLKQVVYTVAREAVAA